MMAEWDLVTATAQVGFPIAVAGYLLLRVESTIKDNTAAINLLRDKIQMICDTIGGK